MPDPGAWACVPPPAPAERDSDRQLALRRLPSSARYAGTLRKGDVLRTPSAMLVVERVTFDMDTTPRAPHGRAVVTVLEERRDGATVTRVLRWPVMHELRVHRPGGGPD